MAGCRACQVSITFRLSALSAQRLRGGQALYRRDRLNYLSAQCPFGTRLQGQLQTGYVAVSITFRLSALSALLVRKYRNEHAAMMVSITFRLSALSALGFPATRRFTATRRFVSITFRLSALSARCMANSVKFYDGKGQSQLPFGSVPFRHSRGRRLRG